ncbi:hypothetical protein MKEN_00240900 [Mycena kentingensis (nom. inval.)]|nr:hypothetical protein MKEN_00240900 [Mycena kentingensis (nom. inval.)]
MTFETKYRVASTRTVRMLALQNTKIPGDEKSISLAGLFGLKKHKKGPRRVAVQHRPSRPALSSSSTAPPVTQQPSPLREWAGSAACDDENRRLLHASAPASFSQDTASKKPYIYESARLASIHPRRTKNKLLPQTTTPTPTTPADAAPAARARPTQRRLSSASRRRGMAVFSDEVRDVLDQLIRMEGKDEVEEELLMDILEGKVAGATQTYQRVKKVPGAGARVERIDGSSRWMQTMF